MRANNDCTAERESIATNWQKKSELNENMFAYCRWLGVIIEGVGSCVVFFTALFTTLNRSTLSPGLAGIAVTYSLQVKYCFDPLSSNATVQAKSNFAAKTYFSAKRLCCCCVVFIVVVSVDFKVLMWITETVLNKVLKKKYRRDI